MDSIYRDWASANGLGGSVEPDEALGPVHVQLKYILEVFKSDLDDIVADYKAKDAITVDATVGFLGKASMGAKSSSLSGKDLIGLNVGTVFWMNELYVRVCKHSGCLLVNDSANDVDFDHGWPKNIDVNNAISGRGALEGFDTNNVFAVTQCVLASSRYILHHELAHIWNGHIECRAAFDSGLLSLKQTTGPIQHAFEVNADIRACWAALRQETFGMFPSFTGNSDIDMGSRYFANLLPEITGDVTFEVKAYRYAISVYLLLRLQIFQQRDKQPSESHPSTISRLIWFFEGCYRIWAIGTNQLPQRIALILRYAFICGEEAFCFVTGQDQLKVDIYIDQALTDRRNAFVTWNTISDSIKPFLRGLNNPDYNLEKFDLDRPITVKILKDIFSQDEIGLNYFQALAIDSRYHAARLFYASKSSLAVLKPAVVDKDLDILQGYCERLTEISKMFLHTVGIDPYELWIEFLLNIRSFYNKSIFLMEDHNKEWIVSKNVIEITDGLVLYFLNASLLSQSDANQCIAREYILNIYENELLEHVDFINIDGVLCDSKPFCLQPFDWEGNVIRPIPNLFPVSPNYNIRTVSGAMYAVIPFFLSIFAEVNLSYRNVRSNSLALLT